METPMLAGRPTGTADDSAVVEARLREAAETGEHLELILVLRGRVRRGSGRDGGRWRIQMDGQRLTFPLRAVAAVTSVSKAPRPVRR